MIKRFATALVHVWSPILIAVALGGCARDARLADQHLRRPVVRTVEHFGIRLDKEATPKQVAYVLLRALHDDVFAKSAAERESALDVEFDVVAADQLRGNSKGSEAEDEALFRIVYHWAPAVGYYAKQLPVDWESAEKRFAQLGPRPVRRGGVDTEESYVLLELADPQGDPDASVVLNVSLVRDSGYWRVIRLAYEPSARHFARPVPQTGKG
ncbi:MAG: hypothetical protein J5J06_13495 [Phycisphaerae bacterium]|nr:hypothetical protein [Phycisphaerae bacterium]